MTFRLFVFWAWQRSQTWPKIVGHNLPALALDVDVDVGSMLSLFCWARHLTGNPKIVLLLQQTVRQINLRPDSRVIWWQICNAWLEMPSLFSCFCNFVLFSLLLPQGTPWLTSSLSSSVFLIMHNFLFPLEWKIFPCPCPYHALARSFVAKCKIN